MTTALIIVDIQNDYFPGGKMELEGSSAASDQARRLLESFRAARLPLVHVQHLSTRPGATFFIPDTPGAQIHSSVQPLAGETVIQKHFPNAFRDTPLLDHLRELDVKRLVLCGMMTHMCVDASVRAASDHGFECLIAQDACATRALSFAGVSVPAAQVHAAFLAALHKTYGLVQPVAEIITRL